MNMKLNIANTLSHEIIKKKHSALVKKVKRAYLKPHPYSNFQFLQKDKLFPKDGYSTVIGVHCLQKLR